MRALVLAALVAAVACGVAAADTVRSRAMPGWGGYEPIWWPNGSRVGYRRTYLPAKDTERYHVGIVRPDGSGFRELARPALSEEWQDGVPSVSPDGKRVLLTRTNYDDSVSRVVVQDVATGVERLLTPRDGQAASGNWSPDGTRVTYSLGPAQASRGDRTPYTARSDGTGARPIGAPSKLANPYYLPGGELIVIVRYFGKPGTAISVVSADGVRERTLTPKNEREWALAGWSSDGSRLLVIRRPEQADPSLWSVPVDGSRRVRLVAGADDGAWSPDGSQLVYTRGEFTKNQGIYVARVDGGGARRIHATGRDPAWSPDGRTIAFADAGDCLESGLYVMRATGGPARRITEDCHIAGTPRADTIRGSSERDVIRGGAGDDRIDANPGDARPVYYGAWDYDDVDGGPGNDTILGRRGADVLRGGPGDDRIVGGRGLDRIYGGPGHDVLDGGPYHDRLYARDGSRDTIHCGPGNDRVWADRFDAVAADCERVIRR